jgi:4'-phosphopantetheinyl transferase
MIGSRRVLAPDEAHIWSANLDALQIDSGLLQPLLSPDETERASRYRLAADARRFAAGRALLRRVLGRYLGISPGSIQFTYSSNGKPTIKAQLNEIGLDFNVSHSSAFNVIALTQNRQVGVDVERLHPGFDHEPVAERFLSQKERAALGSLPEGGRMDGFLAFWTRKEAYVKANGQTVASITPSIFSVDWLPNEPVKSLPVCADETNARLWSFHRLDLDPNYVATLAVRGKDIKLRYFDGARFLV